MPPKTQTNKKESKPGRVSDAGKGKTSPEGSPISPVPELKQHYSAPSYLQSLAENDLPPFKLPPKEPRPVLLVGPTVMFTEDDIVEIIAASDVDPPNARRTFLFELLVKKAVIHKYDLIERDFLLMFLNETIDYAAQRDFSGFQLSILFTIYLTTHLYFKWFYWSQPIAIWNFFKDLMIRHTIEPKDFHCSFVCGGLSKASPKDLLNDQSIFYQTPTYRIRLMVKSALVRSNVTI